MIIRHLAKGVSAVQRGGAMGVRVGVVALQFYSPRRPAALRLNQSTASQPSVPPYFKGSV